MSGRNSWQDEQKRQGKQSQQGERTRGELPVEALPDDLAVARRAAELVLEHARAAIAARAAFTLAVSGGHTPGHMFAELGRGDFPWTQTTIYQVDERIAPEGDAERNLTLLWNSLPERALERVRAMPVTEDDLERAAERYAATLPARFDLIHLGLGTDGHTASLVPEDPLLEVTDRDVALTGHPYMGLRRMTFTYPVLDRARALLWLVTGAEKADALRRLRAADRSIPAGRVARHNALLLADEASLVSDG